MLCNFPNDMELQSITCRSKKRKKGIKYHVWGEVTLKICIYIYSYVFIVTCLKSDLLVPLFMCLPNHQGSLHDHHQTQLKIGFLTLIQIFGDLKKSDILADIFSV